MSNWYVINTKPQQEKKAMLNLVNQNFIVLLPLIRTNKKIYGKAFYNTEPLFPSYLFVKFCIKNSSWLKIKSTYGVKKILSFGEKPYKIDDNFIFNMRKFTNNEGIIKSTFFDFSKSKQAKILKGPFCGSLVEIIKKTNNQRVKVLLNLFKSKIIVSANEDNLTPC